MGQENTLQVKLSQKTETKQKQGQIKRSSPSFATFSDNKGVFVHIVCQLLMNFPLSRGLLGSLGSFREFKKTSNGNEQVMSRTIAVHVRYNSWYICLSPSAKQQHEMTKFWVVWRTWTPTDKFKISISNLTLCSTTSFEIVLTKRNKLNEVKYKFI